MAVQDWTPPSPALSTLPAQMGTHTNTLQQLPRQGYGAARAQLHQGSLPAATLCAGDWTVDFTTIFPSPLSYFLVFFFQISISMLAAASLLLCEMWQSVLPWQGFCLTTGTRLARLWQSEDALLILPPADLNVWQSCWEPAFLDPSTPVSMKHMFPPALPKNGVVTAPSWTSYVVKSTNDRQAGLSWV